MVEVTHGIFQAFSSGDLDAGLKHCAPNAVYESSGRPVGSTGRVEWRFAAIAFWMDGLIVRAITYREIDEARAAAERLAEERG